MEKEESYIRVDGNMKCPSCGMPYRQHQKEKKFDVNDGQELYLIRSCDGRLLKT